MKINNGELAMERIKDELESERTIWLGATVVEEAQQAYERIDGLLEQLYGHMVMQEALEAGNVGIEA